jgi:ELWxxDGT repeat protein
VIATIDGSDSVQLNGKLFFVGDDGTHGRQLWVTDGTAAGTVAITDINDTAGGIFPNNFYSPDLTVINNRLFFNGNDGIHGFEPWISDGTTAGTRMVQDINPGSASSYPASFTAFNGEVYFTADDGTNGTQPWVFLAPLDYTSSGGDVTLTLSGGDLQIVAAGTVVASAPLATVGSVTIPGGDGVANNFTLDYSHGTFVVPGGITFNGGALPATPSNSLTIVGGAFDTDTFKFILTSAGRAGNFREFPGRR